MIKKSATIFGGIVGVFAVFFVTGAVFFSAPTQAYSLSVSAPTNTTISPQNGQTATAAAAIVVQTDCRAGYVLQIQGPTDTNLYLDGDVANNQAGKFVSPVDSSNPLNSQPNTYGYNLLSNSPATKFLPLTNQLTTLKDLSDTASPTQDINDTTNFYWGAYAGAELAAGTYKMASSGAADYIVTAAPTCINYTVNFDKNSATATGTMDPQPISVNIPTKLEPNQFTNNSAFLGWNTKPDGTGKTYTNEEEVLDLAPAEQSITLYAQWEKTIQDISTMQEITPKICAATTIGTEATLRDTRDNKTYQVTKLADGKCWMTQNLDLDLSTSTTLTPADTDLTSNWTPARSTANASNVTNNNIPGWNYDAATPYSVDVGKVYWNGTDGLADFLNGNFGSIFQKDTPFATTGEHGAVGNYYNWPAAIAVNDASGYTDSTFEDITKNPQTSICPKGWRLPTISNQGNGEGSTSEFARLNRLYNRNSTRTSAGWVNEPLRAVRSGYLTNVQHNAGNYIVYWSSTVSSTEGVAYNFRATPTAVYPTGYSPRAEGGSIRCVAREGYTVKFDANGGSGDMPNQAINTGVPTKLSANTFTNGSRSFVGWNTKPDGTGDSYTNEEEVTDLVGKGETITLYAQWTEPTPLEQISTMQEMTSGICSATPVGTEAILEDTRDGKTYSVAKLKDGNCWMTENLNHDIDATKTYTPADTDISSNWTPDVSTINIQGLNVGESVAGWVGAFGDNGLASADPGEVYWDGSTNRHSRIGNYYNWTAALAVNDSGAYSNGTETDPSQNPQTSICPKGWRLPIIANEITGHVDEFKELNRLYNNGLNSTDSGLIASPLYFTRGGVVDQSSELQGVGDAGSYWSSTAGGPMYAFNTAYYFNHNAGGSDSYSSNIAYGYNIRCVARQSYTVSFDSNGGSGTMGAQTINANMPTKLITNSFTIPAGYFLGWNTKPDGLGASIADNELVTNLANANENITLYAQWYRYTLADISTMQEMNSDICANTSTPEVNATSVPEKQLRDTRDNKMYWVAKLADGKCWMTQNLDLDLDETKTYTPSDTDLIENWTPLRSTIDASNVTNRIVPGFEYISTSPYSVDPGDWYWKNDPFYASTNNLFLNNQAGDKFQKNTAFASNGAHGHVGNYYNWTAVVASNDSNEYSADATSDISKRPPNSICPKGWRLPTASNDSAASEGLTNEFGRLNYLYNNGATNTSQNLEAAPLYFVRAGYISNGGAQFSAGNSSIYNSSISRGDTNTFQGMTLRSTAINSNASIARSGAGSVRCVAW